MTNPDRTPPSEKNMVRPDPSPSSPQMANEGVAPSAAIQNLRDHQQQLDADGCMVGVSRQALEETLAQYAALLDAVEFVYAQRGECFTECSVAEAIEGKTRAAIQAATGEA